MSVRRKARLIGRCLRPHGKILDCGSGVGFMSLEMQNSGHDVFSLDLSSFHIEIARRIRKSTECVVASALFLPFRPVSFDAVVFSGVLHHLNDVPEGLKEACGAVKVGGQIFAFEPHKEAWVRRRIPYTILKRLYERSPHIRLTEPGERALSRNELLSAAKAAGLETIQIYAYRPLFLAWLPDPLFKVSQYLLGKQSDLHGIVEDIPRFVRPLQLLGCTLFARFERR